MDETATVGAAVLGGIALGLYKDETAVEKFMEIKAVTYPNKENHEKYKKIIPLFEEVYSAMEPIFGDL
jgi:xylulokinase